MQLANRSRLLGVLAIVPIAFFAFATVASAQFGPPQTIFGSITDSAGVVPEKLPVQAIINDKVCGTGTTEFVGDGSARVTVFAVDVVAKEQTAGCGSDGAEVRIKIGDRFADQKALWRAGPMRVDILFGTGATPAPIPTFTATVPPTQAPASTPAPGTTATPGQTATIPSSDLTPGVTLTATVAGTEGPGAAATKTALTGGLSTTNQGGGGDSGGGGGFPVWGIVAVLLGVVGVAGGGVGVMMARARARERDAGLVS